MEETHEGDGVGGVGGGLGAESGETRFRGGGAGVVETARREGDGVVESDEDVALAVHLALRAWRRELPNRSCAGRAAFDSTEARASFEAELMRRVVEPALGDGLARALRGARDELAALASESGLRAMIGPELYGRAARARARARAAPHRG